jgi:DNA-binding transcriptional LysR family regulator
MATPSLSTALLPDAMMDWRRHYPHARCEVSSHHTAEMLRRLLLGEADFGISLQNARTEGVDTRLLAEHHMVVAARPGTWEQGCTDPLPLGAILGQLVGIAPTDPLGCLVLAAVDAHGLTWNRPTVAQTHQLAGALAACGHGLSLIDPFTAKSMDLQTRPSIPRFPVSLWLLQREGVALSHEALELIDAIGAHAQRACAP